MINSTVIRTLSNFKEINSNFEKKEIYYHRNFILGYSITYYKGNNLTVPYTDKKQINHDMKYMSHFIAT